MASIAGLESAPFGIRENLKQFEMTPERISRQAPAKIWRGTWCD